MIAIAWAVSIVAVAVCAIIAAGFDVRVLQTLLVLILWPWWLLRACVLCALGVSLIVSQSILGIWAKPKTSHYAQRKKPI